MDANVRAFRDSAKRYCDRIESLPELPRPEAIRVALELLAELFCLALQLPEVEPSGLDWPDKVGTEACAFLRQELTRFLGEKDLYWMVFEQTQLSSNDPVASSLSDDLADIWLDVKRGLHTLESSPEAALTDVIWSWKFSFEIHWGRHAVSAMATLLSLKYS
jgi:hypothetical protein